MKKGGPVFHLKISLCFFFVIFIIEWLQAEKVFNQDTYFKKTVKYVGEPMSHLESIASSAVCFCS